LGFIQCFFKGCDVVADLGCGSGKDIAILNKNGVSGYVGVDRNRDALVLAAKRLEQCRMFGWLLDDDMCESGYIPDIVDHVDRFESNCVPTVDGVLSWLGNQGSIGNGLDAFLSGVSVLLKSGGYFVCCIPDHDRFASYGTMGVYSLTKGWYGFTIDKESFERSDGGRNSFKYTFWVGNNSYDEVSCPLKDMTRVCAYSGLSICVDVNVLSFSWTNATLKDCLSSSVPGATPLLNGNLRSVLSYYRLIVLRQELVTGPVGVKGHPNCGCERCCFEAVLPPVLCEECDYHVGRARMIVALQRYADYFDSGAYVFFKKNKKDAFEYIPSSNRLSMRYELLGWNHGVLSQYDPATEEIFVKSGNKNLV